jgi:hypothetical protein
MSNINPSHISTCTCKECYNFVFGYEPTMKVKTNKGFNHIVRQAQTSLHLMRQIGHGPEHVSRDPPIGVDADTWEHAVSTAVKLEMGKTITFIER